MWGRGRLKRKWLLWLAAILLLLVVITPFVKLGFIFLGRALSPAAMQETWYSSWPSNGEVVGTLAPTLRWPGRQEAQYVVDIYEVKEGDIRWTNSLASTRPQLALPAGLLSADEEYYWSVSADLGGALEPLYAGRFSTATRLENTGITVAPATYRINVDSLLNGLELVVDSDGSDDVNIILPPGLTAAGKRKISGTGSFSVRVRPSTHFYCLKPDPEQPTRLGEIEVHFGDSLLTVPIAVDVSNMGQLTRVTDTRFDPELDTPAFSNFADGLLAKLTNGTCLGMVLAVKEDFERRKSCRQDPALSCMPLRVRSLLQPEQLKRRMNYLHLANLDPQNWSLALTSVVGEDSQYGVRNELLTDLLDGNPVPVAVISSQDKAPDRSDVMGHAVLVYAAHAFDDYLLFHIYDPDVVHNKDGVNESFLVVKRDGSWHSRVLYASRDGLERVEIFKVPEPSIVKLLTPIASDAYSALDRGLAEQIR